MKTCTNCGQSKSASEFHKDSRGVQGVRASCKVCDLEKKRRKYNTDEAYRGKVRNYQRGRSEHYSTLNKLWYKENLAYSRDKVRKRYQEDAENRASVKANAAQYRRSKVSAQPACLTNLDKQKIKDIYLLAEDLQLVSGQKYHVDHIVPLRGKGVCGLHVPWNLQVLPADINLSKGNTHENSW